jgi:hypothetical protein
MINPALWSNNTFHFSRTYIYRRTWKRISGFSFKCHPLLIVIFSACRHHFCFNRNNICSFGCFTFTTLYQLLTLGDAKCGVMFLNASACKVVCLKATNFYDTDMDKPKIIV